VKPSRAEMEKGLIESWRVEISQRERITSKDSEVAKWRNGDVGVKVARRKRCYREEERGRRGGGRERDREISSDVFYSFVPGAFG
jgi:hypothetical protein